MEQVSNKVIRESWIDGRRTESEDVVISERTHNKLFHFSLPWYAATVRDHHDTFFPLENRLGKHWYDGYPESKEALRRSTMLEF